MKYNFKLIQRGKLKFSENYFYRSRIVSPYFIIIFFIINLFCINSNPPDRPSSNSYQNLAILTLGYYGYVRSLPNLLQSRSDHTSTLLQDGRVLISGGSSDPASAEIYDPSIEKFVATGNPTFNRRYHTSTLLSNGRVILIGGANISGAPTLSEIYFPNSGIFSNGPDFGSQRYAHTTTVLSNGKLLVVGGIQATSSLRTAQIYDPASNTVTNLSNSLQVARGYHTATLLKTGKVLFIGGSDEGSSETLSSMEIYDPDTNSFSSAGNLQAARKFHTATLLWDGTIFVAGGENSSGTVSLQEIVETERFTTTPSPIKFPRSMHASTVLRSGRVLLMGGRRVSTGGNSNFLNTGEIYDPQTDLSIPSQRMGTARSKLSAVTLQDGLVLLTGGSIQSGTSSLPTGVAELYTSAPDFPLLGPYLVYGCIFGKWC